MERKGKRERKRHTLGGHGNRTSMVLASDLPVTNDPSIAVGAGDLESRGLPDGDELAGERLPEVEAILGGLQNRVDGRNVLLRVGDGIDVTSVESCELLRGGRESVFADDEGRHGVAAGNNGDAGRVGELGQVHVRVGGPVLGHLGRTKGDDVADIDRLADGVAEDIDRLGGGVIVVGRGRADVDTGRGLGRDETGDVADGLAVVGRDVLVAVDLGDGQSRGEQRLQAGDGPAESALHLGGVGWGFKE